VCRPPARACPQVRTLGQQVPDGKGRLIPGLGGAARQILQAETARNGFSQGSSGSRLGRAGSGADRNRN